MTRSPGWAEPIEASKEALGASALRASCTRRVEPVNRERRFEPGAGLRTSQNYLCLERLLHYAPTRVKKEARHTA